MTAGDRVFVDGAGAGHLIHLYRERAYVSPLQPPRWWAVVELDTGRRVTVNATQVKETT